MIAFCPLCKEELIEPKPKKGHYHKFKIPSKCKNGHKFKVFLVAGHLSIEGDYYQSSASAEREKRRVELLDGGVCI